MKIAKLVTSLALALAGSVAMNIQLRMAGIDPVDARRKYHEVSEKLSDYQREQSTDEPLVAQTPNKVKRQTRPRKSGGIQGNPYLQD